MVEIKSYTEILMLTEESPLEVPEGRVIFEQGQKASEMFIVREGTVELRKDGQWLETLGPGSLLGEMALIDPAPRTATAIAGPGCRLVLIDEKTFKQLVQKVPGFALEMLQVVVRRLRSELARG